MYVSTLRRNLLVRFMSVFLLWFSFSAFSGIDQTGKQKVTVIAKNETLESVFKQIEKQTGLRFMYASDAVDVKEKVSVAFEKIALDDVLGKLLYKRGIEWLYRDFIISLKIIQGADVSPLLKSSERGELMRITGRVLDNDGSPIPGATVAIKGTLHGTQTNTNGEFMLESVELNSIILISSIGFESKEVMVKDSIIAVRMRAAVNNLDETVIKGGYYRIKQRYSTGSSVSISASEIEKQPISDPLLALQGRVPGMVITQTTGVPGGEISVQIRGLNSFNNGRQPLFIVDGIPFSATISGINGFGAIGNNMSALSFINPTDIEAIDVLKDADATAIYGSRGANGVVLITTKKGKIGKSKLELNISTGWGNIARKQDLLNTKDYLEMRREALKNDGITATNSNAPDILLWDTTHYTDWQKEMVGKVAAYSNGLAALSGGNAIMQYLIRGNYNRQTTVFPGDFSRVNGGGHFSLTGGSLNQKLRATLTGSYMSNSTNFPGGDFAGNVNLPPNAPKIYNSDGSLNWENSTWQNPYAALKNRVMDASAINIISSLDASYELLPRLLVKINTGFTRIDNETFSANMIAGIDPRYQSVSTATSVTTESKSRSWIVEPQINYNVSLGSSEISALLGSTALSSDNQATLVVASGISDDALIRNPSSATSISARATGNKYKYVAIFGRIGYDLFKRYLLNLTIRRDGSSRFGPRKRYASFGAIGGAWIFSEEYFMRGLSNLFSYGKLRANYGTTGNDQIGDYQYLNRYVYQDFPYLDTKGLEVVELYNADFAWELTKKLEIGLELGVLKEKIFLSSSYYRNRSTNQLLAYPQPSMVGASSIVGNLPAVIQNSGWEFSITGKVLDNHKITWSSLFNISFNRNKLLSYSNNGGIYARVGQSLLDANVYRYVGVDNQIGRFLFEDIEGKHVLSGQADINRDIVSLAPKFFGGFQNSVTYKGFQLDVFFQFVSQNGRTGLFNPNWVPGTRRNQSVEILNRWHKPGDVAPYSKVSQNSTLSNDYRVWLSSNIGYTNASFIRCKNLMFSWQFPESFIRKKKISNLKLYLQSQNLFTITSYKGWDPETQSVTVIPPLRMLTLGAQFSM